jgi:uncharacterized protein (UPF0332 family)
MSTKPIFAEIERGDESLKSARLLSVEQLNLDAMSRIYYAVLHYARAVLLVEQVMPKSHHGAFLLFSQHIVKTGKADKRYGKIFSSLIRMREEADYVTGATFSKEDVDNALREAEEFRENSADFYQGYRSTVR